MSRVVALFDATEHEQRILRQASPAAENVACPGVTASPGDLREAEVAIVFSFADLPQGIWKEAQALRWIISLPAGANHIPFHELPPAARVVSLHGPNAQALAEHAFALMLAGAKRIVPDQAALRAGRFDQSRMSRQLARSTLAVVGAGAIGTEVLHRARAFRMWRFAITKSGHPHPEADETLMPEQLHTALARADFVVLSCPLTHETRGMIDARALQTMKPDAVLVNVARGGIVDREALAAHLEAHPAFTYATDVWWRYPKPGEAFREPLVERENVIGTPHAGALVADWREKMVAAAARVLADIAATGEPDLGLGSAARLEAPGDLP